VADNYKAKRATQAGAGGFQMIAARQAARQFSAPHAWFLRTSIPTPAPNSCERFRADFHTFFEEDTMSIHICRFAYPGVGYTAMLEKSNDREAAAQVGFGAVGTRVRDVYYSAIRRPR